MCLLFNHKFFSSETNLLGLSFLSPVVRSQPSKLRQEIICFKTISPKSSFLYLFRYKNLLIRQPVYILSKLLFSVPLVKSSVTFLGGTVLPDQRLSLTLRLSFCVTSFFRTFVPLLISSVERVSRRDMYRPYRPRLTQGPILILRIVSRTDSLWRQIGLNFRISCTFISVEKDMITIGFSLVIPDEFTLSSFLL